MNRKKIAAGNWKMHKTFDEAQGLAHEIRTMAEKELMGEVSIMIFPPFPYLHSLTRQMEGSRIICGAQNMHEKGQGAYTGEISASMLTSIGINHVIIGHSERRQYYNESNQSCSEKIKIALNNKIIPIYCIGETLVQRESGEHFKVVLEQLSALNGIERTQINSCIIAYEPVWAIGTGQTATADQANEMHIHIRSVIATMFDKEVAEGISILYGGSVKSENAKTLFGMSDIDGALIGGASLSSRDFIDIAKSF